MRKALVVGINYYPWLGSLQSCVNDASSVVAMLSRHHDLKRNFDITPMYCTDADSACDRELLRDRIINLFKDTNEIALLYFAGHGGQSEDSGYLLTSECKSASSGIPFDDVVHFANESPAGNRLIIFDCCHSGGAGNQRGSAGVSVLREGTTILAASHSQQQAEERREGGVFTMLLVDALRGAAADILGNITPGAIYAHIDKSLGGWEQRPIFKTNIREFSSLRSVSPEIDLADLHRITTLFKDPDAVFQLDPSFEPHPATVSVEYPPDPENCAIFVILQSYFRLNLLRPVGEKHMYFAAMHSRNCQLTPLGKHYWQLAKKGYI